jgi:hypothetical protein
VTNSLSILYSLSIIACSSSGSSGGYSTTGVSSGIGATNGLSSKIVSGVSYTPFSSSKFSSSSLGSGDSSKRPTYLNKSILLAVCGVPLDDCYLDTLRVTGLGLFVAWTIGVFIFLSVVRLAFSSSRVASYSPNSIRLPVLFLFGAESWWCWFFLYCL